MANLICLSKDFWQVGDLNALQQWMPGGIRRVFYIYELGEMQRAGHSHRKTWHAMVCIQGSCRVELTDGMVEQEFWLHDPCQCLIIRPEDWHTMDRFSEDAILLVFSNEAYDPNDYIYERPVVRINTPTH